MALKKFNSVQGFSVGTPGNVIDVVDNVANVYANRLFVTQYSNLGDVANIYIGGGTTNQVLKTDGTGNLYWALDTAPAGGNTTEVQFNNSGSLDGSSALTFNNVTNAFSITGNITTQNANLGNLVTANYFAGTLTSSAQPNVTSVGTLSSLTVTANITSGNATLGNLVTANYFTGNASLLSSITGANVTGQVGNALVSGTVYTAAQPNITSVGTLASLTVTANITSGNASLGNVVTANYFVGNGSLLTGVVANANYAAYAGNIVNASQPNITSVGALASLTVTGLTTATGGVKTANIQDVTGTVTIQTKYNTYAGDVGITSNLTVGASGVGNLTVNGVSNLGPVGNVKITGGTANYVLTTDGAGGLSWTNPITDVIAGSDTQLQFNDGGSFGADANLTYTKATDTLNVKNINVESTGNISGGNLVSASYLTGALTTAAQPNITSTGTLNGVTATGTVNLTGASNVSLGSNAVVHITGGTNGQVLKTDGAGNLYWGLDSALPSGSNSQIQFNDNGSFGGVPGLTFDKFTNTLSITGNVNTGQGASGNITGANYVIANYFTGTLTTAAQPNITSIGTLASINVTGNVSSGGNIIGNGQYLTGLPGGNVSGQVANALVAGTVYTAAQPNITSVGTLSSVNVTGNVSSGGNIIGNGQYLTSLAGGNVTGQVGNALVAGTVYTAAQPNITSVGTLSSVIITGNVSSGGNIIGNGQYLTGLPAANITGQVANALVAGTVYTAAQPNITSVGTLSSLTVTGNITGANFIGNHYGNGATLSSITGANVTGQVGNALVAGTVYTAAQPNITSVGTLTSVVVSTTANVGTLNATDGSVSGNVVISGNLTVSGTATYINVNNLAVKDPIIEMGGGANNTPLASNDGKDRGSLLHYYTTTPVDAFMGWDNSNAEFAFGSNVSVSSEVVTFNSFGNVRVGNIIGSGQYLTNVTGGNVTGQVANALVAGTVYTNAQPNITSVGTLTTVNVSGNVSSGGNIIGNGQYLTAITGGNVTGQVANALVAGTVYTAAQPNITSVGTLTTVNVSGNVSSGGNIIGNGQYLSSLTGGNVTGQVANALVAGTVYTAAQPNITSVGTLTTLRVSGNANVDGTLFTSNVVGSSANVTITAASYVSTFDQTGNITLSNNVTVAANFIVNQKVDFTTTPNVTLGAVGNIHITGGSSGYMLSTNGSGGLSWVSPGSTGIAGTNTQVQFNDNGSFGATSGFTFDKISNALTVVGNVTAGNVKTDNLLYANGVAWSFGSSTYSNANVAAYLPTYTGNVSANYFIGNGSTLTNITGGNVTGQVGNALVAGTVYTAAQPNITSVGTLSSVNVSGNVSSGGNIIGNGQYLTAIAGGNVTGQVANALVAGTVYTAAQPNITSVGTLASLSVTANVSAGNILTDHLLYANGVTWNFGSTYSNVDVAAYLPTYTGNVSANYFIGNGSTLTHITGGNVDGQVSNALISGTVYTAAQPNITSVGTLASLSATGNISSGSYFVGNGAYLTGLPASYANANVAAYLPTYTGNVSAAYFIGNGSTLTHITGGNVDGQVGNSLVAGTVYTNAQPNITSVGTLSGLTVSGLTNLGSVGNVTIIGGASGYVLTTDGTGNLTWGSAGSGAAGLVSISKDRFLTTGSANTFSLSTTPGSVNLIEVVIDGLQQISNTYSLAGSTLSFSTNPAAGQVIEVTTFGAVDLTGNVGEVQYNAGGAFGSSNAFTFNSGTNTLSVTNVTATGNLTSQGGYVYVDTAMIAVSSGNAGIFNTSVGNINLGLGANVTIGSTTGNTTIRGNLLANTASINTIGVSDYYSSRAATVVTTDTIIDQFAVNTYRSAKYTMRVNSDAGYQAVEVLLVHDGSSSYVTIYGSISSTGSDIVSLSSNIGSGNVRLFATTTSTNTNMKILGTYVPD